MKTIKPQKNTEILAVQTRKTPNARNMILINKCMDKTFPEQRKFFTEKIRKIEEIYKEYPLPLSK